MSISLVVAGGVLALVYGTNAGGTIVSAGAGLRAMRPLVSVLLVGVAIAVAPALVGTAVATTIAEKLLPLGGRDGQQMLLAAVVAAIAVTMVLSKLGIPTSLTLALLSAMAGVGLGTGQPVAWSHLLLVFAIVAVAPVLGAATALALTRVFAWWRPAATAHRHLVRLHILAFAALTFAFAANDAQKLLGVFAVASGATAAALAAPPWWMLAGIGAIFALGTAFGMRRMGRATTAGIVAAHPIDAVIAELSTAGVMLASTGLGSPVGMSQTLTGSFLGAGLSKGPGRIRWPFAGRIARAWFATLPAALILGWVMGALLALVGAASDGWHAP